MLGTRIDLPALRRVTHDWPPMMTGQKLRLVSGLVKTNQSIVREEQKSILLQETLRWLRLDQLMRIIQIEVNSMPARWIVEIGQHDNEMIAVSGTLDPYHQAERTSEVYQAEIVTLVDDGKNSNM